MIWSDIATWVGPTTARNGGAMAHPPQGLVLHIASGFYDGTISWQRRSSGTDRTSSHFIVARDGRCAQMVDTADGSWAQKSGNNTWLSVELEGFAPEDGLHASHPGWETATPQQVEACARLLAKAHAVYGVPLQLATSPSGRGLGHHSMGAESGVDWGHSLCPGTSIKAQKPAILARAQAIAGGQMNVGGVMAVTDLRIKLMYEMWAPSRDEWVKAGGAPATYDLLAQDGSGQNNLAIALNAMDEKLDQLLARPAATVDVPALAKSLEDAGVGQVDVTKLVDALAQHLPSHITLTGTVA